MANYQPVRLAYTISEPIITGDPNLSPIIFLHGLTVFKEHWGDIPQIVANATKRKAYALDARNHGDSDWSDDFSFDLNAEDIIHFMDLNEINKAILVGHSMGGITAIKAALRRPDRIEKIVVEDMLVRKIPKQMSDSILSSLSNTLKALEILPDDLDEDGAKKFIWKYYLSNLPPEMTRLATRENSKVDKTQFVKLRRGANGRFTFKANIRALEKALKDYDSLSSEESGVYQGPALFIYGKLSPILVAADAHHIKKFFPNAVFEGVEDASHDVHTEQPLEFTDAVLKFIF